jgi:hypothetical protein
VGITYTYLDMMEFCIADRSHVPALYFCILGLEKHNKYFALSLLQKDGNNTVLL